MTREEWQRVKTITTDALALPDTEREAFVATNCGDAAFRDEVESLLAAAVAATDLFERPALTAGSALAILARTEDQGESFVGRRIGPYHVIRELGRGGMGTAYLAERVDQVYRRRVAIKLIKRGMDTDAIVRRFLHERQILANLSHPNIAMLLDGGTTDEGRPYFIMEYIEGLPIDRFCIEKRLPVAERLKLFRAVCDAVHHAHENRVIHRDLKPGNILVTQSGVPKLLDFGIAKLLDPAEGPHTGDGTLPGGPMTLQYASPEQVHGEPITPASDVYSLGVLLYELLTDRAPYDFTGRTRHEAERLVCDEMPPRPSRANAAVRRQLAGNLDAIALTALRKEPERRYATARALADDIDRHLDGRPVTARKPRMGLRIADVARRRRAVWAAAAIALVLAAASVVAVLLNRRAAAGGAPIASIAVLPLAAAGESSDLDYLLDGITESIINRLSRVSTVKVIARDSVYRYKGKAVDPREVGRDLGVQAIVTGRVVHRDDELTLSVSLVDTRDRRQLWGRQYRRPVKDVQLLQADLAQEIAAGLRLELSPEERTRFDQAGSHDPEAYVLHLKGRYFWNKRTPSDLRRSIGNFKQAIAIEPDFAEAHAGLADSLSLLTEYHAAPARQTYDEARRAALRALAIDEGLAEAHTSLAYIKQFYEWDWNGAEADFRRAIDLNPRYATAHQWYAEFLSTMGRHDEALAEIRLAADIDPLSLIVNAVHANLLYMARRYDEAIEQCMKVIEMDPNFPEVYEYLKRSLDQKGLYKDAIAARQMRRRILGLDASQTDPLRLAASATSRRVYWQNRLDQEIVESRTEGVQPYEMAEILAQAGDTPRALDWLENACAADDFMTMYMRVAPNLDALRAELRFQALLRKGCRI